MNQRHLKTTILLLLAILFSACSSTPTPVPPKPLFREFQANSRRGNLINIYIDQIEILQSPPDFGDTGQLRVIIQGVSTNGKSGALYCPDGEALSFQKNQKFDSPCLFGVSFDQDTVGEGVFLILTLVDEDDPNLLSEIGWESLAGVLSELGLLVAESVGWISRPAPTFLTIAVGTVTGLAVGAAKEYYDRADIIGVMGFGIQPDTFSDWGTTTYETNDGTARVKLTITRGEDSDPESHSPKAEQPTLTKTSKPVSQVEATRTPRVPAAPTKTSSSNASRSASLAMLYEYHKAINNQNYKKAWGMITDSYKANNPSITYEEFKAFWAAVEKVDILDVKTERSNNQTAYIILQIQYNFNNGNVKREEREYSLIYMPSDGVWRMEDTDFLQNIP